MTRLLLHFFILVFPLFLQAKQKICLNMILTEECREIAHTLDSIKPFIDYWVIVDTTSNKETQKIVRKHLKNVPGELLERVWKNYGQNRTEAFNLAKSKGDYILFAEEDDLFRAEQNFKVSLLENDLYLIAHTAQEFSCQQPRLVKASLPCKWVGVAHEYLEVDRDCTVGVLENITTETQATESNLQRLKKNVSLLTEGLKKEPENGRYAFYLAQNYRDLGECAKALEYYQKRIDREGLEEEVYWSKLQIGHMLRELGLPAAIAIEAYKDAIACDPQRKEAIYYLAELYNESQEYQLAYDCLKNAASSSGESFFKEEWIEEYGLSFQLSICLYYLEKYSEALTACNEVLKSKHLAEPIKIQTEANLAFIQEKTCPCTK